MLDKTMGKKDNKVDEIIKKIEDSYYWDMPVMSLDLMHLANELIFVFEDAEDDNIAYHFINCYKINIEFCFEYTKYYVYSDVTFRSTSYFMQDVKLKEVTCGEKKYLQFEINMWPIELLIVCEEFELYTV